MLIAAAVTAVGALVGVESVGSQASDSILRIRLPSLHAETRLWYAEDVVPAAPGRPWTVVGYLVDSLGGRTPSAWTSGDGVTWRRTTLPPSSSPGRDGVFAVAGRGNALAAFGQMDVGTGQRLAFWTGRAGRWAFSSEVTTEWRDVKQVSITGQAAGSGGFVAVGDEINATSARAIVLESADGRSWRSLALPELIAPPDSAMHMTGVALNGGRALVVGSTARRVASAGAPRAVAFRRDGGRWSPVTPATFGTAGSIFLNGVAALGDGFVVVGTRAVGSKLEPAAWVSTDGSVWRASKPTAFPTPRRMQAAVYAVERLGQTLVAIGEIEGTPWAWASDDGLRWRNVRLPDGIYRFGVPTRIAMAASGTRLLLVLRNQSGASLWLYAAGRWREVGRGAAFPSTRDGIEVRGTAASGAGAVAVGNASFASKGEARVWARASSGWAKGSIPDARSAALTSVAAIRTGFVAGGLTTRGQRFAAAVWRSADGRTWSRATVPRLAPTVDSAVQAVVWDGRQAIAAVNEVVRSPVPKRISLIASRDGRVWRRIASVASGQIGAEGMCAASRKVLITGVVRVGQVERGAVWEHTGRRWRRVLLPTSSVARSCAIRNGLTVVVGALRGQASVWRRTGSSDWQQAPLTGDLLPTAPPRALNAVAATSAGFVAVGGDGARGEYDLGVWTSVDGETWRLVRSPDLAFHETGHQKAAALAIDRRARLILGGSSVGSGALWEGAVPIP